MRELNDSAPLTLATMLAIILGAYLFSGEANAESDYQDISRVNGSIEVKQGQQAGNVSTVNGRVQILDGASVGSVSTVNGSIELSRRSSARNTETVNGDIQIGNGVMVDGSLGTVNGDIRIRDNASIGDSIRTVNGNIELNTGVSVTDKVQTANGDIRLIGSSVGGDLVTRNGDVSLQASSTVTGDIVFHDDSRWWDRFFRLGRLKTPRIHIDASSAVRGNIHLHRPVDLDIESGSVTGEIVRHY